MLLEKRRGGVKQPSFKQNKKGDSDEENCERAVCGTGIVEFV